LDDFGTSARTARLEVFCRNLTKCSDKGISAAYAAMFGVATFGLSAG
jgi:hypothetical protein